MGTPIIALAYRSKYDLGPYVKGNCSDVVMNAGWYHAQEASLNRNDGLRAPFFVMIGGQRGIGKTM